MLGRYGRSFAAGETLFKEGAVAKEAFLLQDGRVRLLKRVRMVERSLMVLKPGDLFGESALLDAPTARNSTAIALSEGTVLALDRSTFKGLLANYPSVAARVIDQLVRRLRDAEDQIEIMMLRDAQSKIVSALLKLTHEGDAQDANTASQGGGGAAASSQVQPAAGGAAIAVSPVELSVRVGLDVESVKRGVQRLRDQHYIRIVGERIEIPDVDALRRLYVLLGTKDELRGDGR